jgi:hypothetical protein
MKLIGIVVGAAILTAAPFSLQCTPRKAGLYVDRADARVVHRRRVYHGYYGMPQYGAAHPRSFVYGYSAQTPAPAPYYGVLPYPYSPGPPNIWGGFSGGYR